MASSAKVAFFVLVTSLFLRWLILPEYDENVHLEGEVDPKFQKVHDAFRQNLAQGWERGGGSFVVYHKGKKVVDIWGGYADRQSHRKWSKDTLSIMFSSTKALGALCIAKLVDEGHVKYDDLVTSFWPKFGQNGKENITVRWVLQHRSALAYTDHPITEQHARNPDDIARIFEEQVPNYPPGTEIGYHAITYGWLVDQIVRRVDPKKRSVGQYFRDELQNGLDLHIGLPECQSHRVARITAPTTKNVIQEYIHKPSDFKVMRFVEQLWTNGSLAKISKTVPWIGFVKEITVNNPDFYTIEQAGALGIGVARDLAYLFEQLRAQKLVSAETFKQLTTGFVKSPDVVTGANVGRSTGLMESVFPYNGKIHRLIGHSGYGGQNVRMDLKEGITLAYISNGLKVGFGDTARTYIRLLEALYTSLE